MSIQVSAITRMDCTDGEGGRVIATVFELSCVDYEAGTYSVTMFDKQGIRDLHNETSRVVAQLDAEQNEERRSET